LIGGNGGNGGRGAAGANALGGGLFLAAGTVPLGLSDLTIEGNVVIGGAGGAGGAGGNGGAAERGGSGGPGGAGGTAGPGGAPHLLSLHPLRAGIAGNGGDNGFNPIFSATFGIGGRGGRGGGVFEGGNGGAGGSAGPAGSGQGGGVATGAFFGPSAAVITLSSSTIADNFAQGGRAAAGVPGGAGGTGFFGGPGGNGGRGGNGGEAGFLHIVQPRHSWAFDGTGGNGGTGGQDGTGGSGGGGGRGGPGGGGGNSGGAEGGGIYAGGGSLTLIADTVSGNSVVAYTGGQGGAGGAGGRGFDGGWGGGDPLFTFSGAVSLTPQNNGGSGGGFGPTATHQFGGALGLGGPGGNGGAGGRAGNGGAGGNGGSGGSSGSAFGGGIFSIGGALTMLNSTVAGNSVATGPAGQGGPGGGGGTVANTFYGLLGLGGPGGFGGLGRSGFGPAGAPGAPGAAGHAGSAGFSGGPGFTGTASGGGMYLLVSTVALYNDTIAFADSGGGVFQRDGTANLYNTLISGNAGFDYATNGAPANAFFCLVTAGSGLTETNPVTGDPGLGTLANNGGPTLTISIAVGGAADGTGQNGIGGVTLLTDQRGYVPTDGAWDVGAYQAEAAPPSTAIHLRHVNTGLIGLTRFGLIYNRKTGFWSGNVQITNNGSSAFSGPVFLVLTGLTPAVLENATGSYGGNDYLQIGVGTLAPGQTVTATLVFKKAVVKYAPVFYLGALGS
jgi:hypothetical protein